METPPTPPLARVIVCEQRGRWAVALRRELAGAGVRVWETRTLDDCMAELARSPASIAVVEASRDVAPLWRVVEQCRRRFPAVRIAVVADRSMAEYEGLMYEVGAVYFSASPRQVRGLAEMLCRHLAEVPPPEQSLTERIWASLPWAAAR